jgi:hypothetical protein
MRLSPDEIQYISRKIVKTLTSDRRIEVDDEDKVIEGIARVITEELQVEDRLNEEVREVLIQHTAQMERSDITYSEMFKKVKRELAKQKGIIL